MGKRRVWVSRDEGSNDLAMFCEKPRGGPSKTARTVYYGCTVGDGLKFLKAFKSGFGIKEGEWRSFELIPIPAKEGK